MLKILPTGYYIIGLIVTSAIAANPLTTQEQKQVTSLAFSWEHNLWFLKMTLI